VKAKLRITQFIMLWAYSQKLTILIYSK